MTRGLTGWGMEWHSRNRLNGDSRYLLWGPLFRTRQECRAFIDAKFGYIRERDDLKNEPHGWRVPRAVRVSVRVAQAVEA